MKPVCRAVTLGSAQRALIRSGDVSRVDLAAMSKQDVSVPWVTAKHILPIYITIIMTR